MAGNENLLRRDDPFINDDVFDEEVPERDSVRCATCGAEVNVDSSFCPYCGAQIESKKKEIKEVEEEVQQPQVLKPRPLQKGEKVTKSNVQIKEHKYGDGHSVSSLSMGAVYLSVFLPVLSLIISIVGLSSKNPKDVKVFKIGIFASILFLIVHVVIIYLTYIGVIHV